MIFELIKGIIVLVLGLYIFSESMKKTKKITDEKISFIVSILLTTAIMVITYQYMLAIGLLGILMASAIIFIEYKFKIISKILGVFFGILKVIK